MRKYILCLFVLWSINQLNGQVLPNLPIPLGAATAEVWNNEIYHFGGSNNWAGSIVYPRIYKFDGLNWSLHDSIPDNNLWDVESVLIGDWVYLISGWPSGANLIRKYNLSTQQWIYLANSPNTQTWGVAAEHLNGIVYLFDSNGQVFKYSIANDQWSTGTSNSASGSWDLSSILHQNEIYVIGWSSSEFYKYTPSQDQWSQLANSPYQVGACAMAVINDSVFCAGGNLNGSQSATYESVIVYDIPSNTWRTDSARISSKRHWMSTAEYSGGLYLIGGIDSTTNAVDIVEELVPQGTAVGISAKNSVPHDFALYQNYPNPFNPTTTITFEIASPQLIKLTVFDITGKEISVLVNGKLAAGFHQVRFNGDKLASGFYFYKLASEQGDLLRKMLLVQ